MTNPTQALDAIEQALTDGKKLLVAIKNSNDLDGRIAFLPQKTEETIQNVFEALAHIATLKQQVAELVAFREAHEWRPIETAPKDGTEVMLYRPLAYKTHDPVIAIKETSKHNRPPWDCTVPKGCEPINYTEGACYPSYWQPLPAPPAAEGGQCDD